MQADDTMKTFLRIDARDNVAVALTNLEKDCEIQMEGTKVLLRDAVKAKHKFLLEDIYENGQVIMYGVTVGRAKMNLQAGDLLDLNNLVHAVDKPKIRETNYHWSAPSLDFLETKTFKGFKRSKNECGTANYWLVIPLVFCENKNVRQLQESMSSALGYRKAEYYELKAKEMVAAIKSGKKLESLEFKPLEGTQQVESPIFKNIDGIKCLLHDGGCGGTNDDSDTLCELLSGYITHSNVAGATIIGLGCQKAKIEGIRNGITKRDANFSKPLIIYEQQDFPNEESLLTQAMKESLSQMAMVNEQSKREDCNMSHLIVGVECGGSDGFSGISANPAIGYASDCFVTGGASVMLSEFPELCGIEQELLDRMSDEKTARRFLELMQTYESRANELGAGFDMNPSPGNIREGLITDAMKSAGAAKKGGCGPIVDVLDYTEKLSKNGLNLLCTPGNDVESTTGLAGSGANLILFSTGLGTPTGNPIVPVIKISSSTKLFHAQQGMIDFNAGEIITGKALSEVGEDLVQFSLSVASGNIKTKADLAGQDDFLIWKRGISL